MAAKGGGHVKAGLPLAVVGSRAWRSWFPLCSRACRRGLWEGLSHDKRGRLHDLLAQVLGKPIGAPVPAPALLQEVLSSISPPAPYVGGGAASAPKAGVASRVALPAVAATVPLSRWLPPDVLDAFNNPEQVLPDVPRPCGYMGFSMVEWRKLVRRLARSGLVQPVSDECARPHPPAGTFVVPKDAGWDRLIGTAGRPIGPTLLLVCPGCPTRRACSA